DQLQQFVGGFRFATFHSGQQYSGIALVFGHCHGKYRWLSAKTTMDSSARRPRCFLPALSRRGGLNEGGRLIQGNSCKDPARPCIGFILSLMYMINDRCQSVSFGRSEERRVGKECRCRRWAW